MKFDHTPGPWNYKMDITENGFDVSSEKEIIASRYPAGWSEYDKIEMEANARLIAAAPEMLKELRKCFKDGMEGYQMREEQAVRIKNILESATGKIIEEILKIDEVE